MAEQAVVKRCYRGEDGYMLQSARLMHTLLMQHMTQFADFSTAFTPQWAADWLADITAVENLTTDDVHIDEVAETTTQVLKAMMAARNKWAEVNFFIRRAFANDASAKGVFGAAAYSKVRGNQLRMIEFLRALHGAATDHAAQLIAAGYTQPQIDEIDTICTTLQQKAGIQTRARRNRPKLTANRILALNVPYRKMMEVSEAAQIIFMDSEATRKMYVYYPRKRKKTEAENPVQDSQ